MANEQNLKPFADLTEREQRAIRSAGGRASVEAHRRIHFYKGLTHTLKEMQSYVWDDKALQNTGREKPINVADHAPDAVR